MNNNYEVIISTPKKKPYKNVYQFKIKLLYTKPPVWRRIQVPGYYTFYELHLAIQNAMGWSDCHLHGFEIRRKNMLGKVRVARVESPVADPDIFSGEQEELYSTEVPISSFFIKEKDRAMYEYDYGDSWRHEIALEKILPRQKGQKYPVCLAGKLSCPPEDCGSVPGYYRCVEAVEKGDDLELLNWIGDWRPDDFDPKDVVFEDPGKRLEEIL